MTMRLLIFDNFYLVLCTAHAKHVAEHITDQEAEGRHAQAQARHLKEAMRKGQVLRHGDIKVEQGNDHHGCRDRDSRAT